MNRSASLRAVIEAYFGALRKSQRKTILALTLGLLESRQVGLASIARGMRCAATVASRIARAWRFVRNSRITMAPVTRAMVRAVCGSKESRPVVAFDWTEIGEYYLLVASVVLKRRAIPVAWLAIGAWKFNDRRRSRNHAEEVLIERVHEAMAGRRWTLLGDRGFARAELFRTLNAWKVRFVIRALSTVTVQYKGFSGPLGNVPRAPQSIERFKQIAYRGRRPVEVDLVVTHAEPAPEPWYLITNVPNKAEVVRLYRRRMWVEECFRDQKTTLGMKRLNLAEPERVERMMILVAITLLVAMLTAEQYRQRHGQRNPGLATWHRQVTLSIVRLGLELIQQYGLPWGLRHVSLENALRVS
jgi:hypothetical protein